jgi:hypothetical protein
MTHFLWRHPEPATVLACAEELPAGAMLINFSYQIDTLLTTWPSGSTM